MHKRSTTRFLLLALLSVLALLILLTPALPGAASSEADAVTQAWESIPNSLIQASPLYLVWTP